MLFEFKFIIKGKKKIKIDGYERGVKILMNQALNVSKSKKYIRFAESYLKDKIQKIIVQIRDYNIFIKTYEQ